MSDSESSGPEDRNPPTKKPKITASSSTKSKAKPSGDKDGVFEISPKRFVSVSEFKGKTRVDIREFYEDNAGELKPTKKGISLSLEEWKKFKQVAKDVDNYISGKGEDD